MVMRSPVMKAALLVAGGAVGVAGQAGPPVIPGGGHGGSNGGGEAPAPPASPPPLSPGDEGVYSCCPDIFGIKMHCHGPCCEGHCMGECRPNSAFPLPPGQHYYPPAPGMVDPGDSGGGGGGLGFDTFDCDRGDECKWCKELISNPNFTGDVCDDLCPTIFSGDRSWCPDICAAVRDASLACATFGRRHLSADGSTVGGPGDLCCQHIPSFMPGQSHMMCDPTIIPPDGSPGIHPPGTHDGQGSGGLGRQIYDGAVDTDGTADKPSDGPSSSSGKALAGGLVAACAVAVGVGLLARRRRKAAGADGVILRAVPLEPLTDEGHPTANPLANPSGAV